MERTYRPARSYRDAAIFAMAVSGVMAALTLVGMLREPVIDFRLLFPFGIFLGFSLLNLYLLVIYRRAKLVISDDRLTIHGPLRARTVALADVVSATWNAYQGSVLLKTATSRVRLRLSDYDSAHRREFVRFLRESLPEEIQEDWGFFYQRIVSRWRKDPTPQAGDILITRRRYDYYALWTFFLLLGLAVAAALQFRGVVPWYHWAALPALAGVWVCLRYSIPRGGMVHRPTRRSRRGLSMFLVALVAPLAMFPVMAFLPEFFKTHEVLLSVVMVCWAIPAIAAGLVFLHRDECRERDEANLAARDLSKIPRELLED